jgi:selenocysteine-specific elongation factor
VTKVETQTRSPLFRFLAGKLRLSPEAVQQLKNGAKVRLSLSGSEANASVVFLDRSARLKPGETAFVQFRLDAPVAAARRDRCAVRLISPERPLGEAELLCAGDEEFSRFGSSAVRYLKMVVAGDVMACLEAELLRPRKAPPTLEELARDIALSPEETRNRLAELGDRCIVVEEDDGRHFVHAETLDRLLNAITDVLKRHHQKQPTSLGLTKKEIRRHLPEVQSDPFLRLIIDRGLQNGRLGRTADCLHLVGWSPRLSPGAGEIRSGMLRELGKSPFQPPGCEDLIGFFRPVRETERVFQLLVESGEVVKVSAQMAFLKESIEQARTAVQSRIEQMGAVTAADLRDILGTSRKYAIALLEHFDRTGFTVRVGDKRILKT